MRPAVLRPLLAILRAALCGAALLWAPPLAAQGGGYATLSGTIRNASTLQPVLGALVTLTPVGGGAGREVSTGGSGTYAFTLVAPGSYELRAEAVGYRPMVARTLLIEGGERATVSLALNVAPPPVTSIDTVAVLGGGAGRWRAGGTRFGAVELFGALPHRYDDLSSIAALASAAGESMGLQGLPGGMTGLVADGVPMYRAEHPLAAAELVSVPLFPRSMLSSVTVGHAASGVALPGTAGGYVAMSSLAAAGGSGLGVAWSGDPLWSSSQLDFDAPAMTSIQGDATWSGVTSPTTRLTLAADGMRLESPLAPRIGEAVAGSLAGLDAALLEDLGSPSVETFSRFAGGVRFDGRRGDDAQIFARAGVAYTARDLDGPGPLDLPRSAVVPEESLDLSFAGGWTSQVNDDWIADVRLGVSGSDRKFEASDPARPFALLAGTGSLLGDAAYGAAEASRFDVVVLPSAHWNTDLGTVRMGIAGRLSRHAITQAPAVQAFFSDGAALLAGQGYVHAFDAPKASFSTRELGAYVAFDAELRPGVSTSLGVRVDQEAIPSSEASLDTEWLQASGLRNDEYPSSFVQLGGSATLTWDPSLDGATVLTASAAMQHGDLDPAALAQLFSQDGSATSARFAGSGITWPDGALPGAATPGTTLTLLGPDARAPRTVSGALGFVRRLAGGWSVHAEGAIRRTDFLLRRRDLNRPAVPQAQDPYGRNVFGTLVQDGSLVTATGADSRRFGGFEEVWALDPDGWSEYWGVTAGLDYSSGPTTLYAAYTRSETKDNWVGASAGLVDLALPPVLSDDESWAEGTSDFDVPDRVVAGATTSLGVVTLSAVYRFRSGLPFTPRYRAGVDANGDGAFRNDVPFVDDALISAVPDLDDCVTDQVGAFAARNSCRGPAVHAVDARLRLRLGRVMGRDASLTLDGLNLIESEDGLIDDALMLVDPTGTITSAGGVVTIPLLANPDFGSVLHPSSRGRVLRVGLRIG